MPWQAHETLISDCVIWFMYSSSLSSIPCVLFCFFNYTYISNIKKMLEKIHHQYNYMASNTMDSNECLSWNLKAEIIPHKDHRVAQWCNGDEVSLHCQMVYNDVAKKKKKSWIQEWFKILIKYQHDWLKVGHLLFSLLDKISLMCWSGEFTHNVIFVGEGKLFSRQWWGSQCTWTCCECIITSCQINSLYCTTTCAHTHAHQAHSYPEEEDWTFFR